MGTPSRQNIVSNLKTTLETITTGNGYDTDVATVQILAKSWLQVPQQIRPWLGIVPQETNYQYLPNGIIRSVLVIDIIGHVANGTAEQKRARLSGLIDDLFAALNVDTTRNGNAVMTTVVSSETDEGDPESDGTLVLRINVVYMRTTGST
tara:strand:+ start:781 stop:1230 length:450 start_codon:yes stop_codon:yes gene_type:complete